MNIRVLIVSNDLDEARRLRGFLAENFDSVEISTVQGQEVADFERLRPQVLVFAHRDVRESEHCYVALMRKSRIAYSHSHEAIVLCDSAEAAAAANLCKQGTFDDYVLQMPESNDPWSLATSILVAVASLRRLQVFQPIGSFAKPLQHARA